MSDKRGSGPRALKQRVKTARKRTLSSQKWLERQLNDPYVARAKREGYRSRAAYKLLEIDEQLRLLKPGPAGGRPRRRAGRLVAGRGGSGSAAPAARAGSSASISCRSSRCRASSFIALDFLDEAAPDG